MIEFIPAAIMIALALGILAIIGYKALTRTSSVSLEKPKAKANIREGTVMRIAVLRGGYGGVVHIMLEEEPDAPISLEITTGTPAIALTKEGDRVRIEMTGEHDDEYELPNQYEFHNLNTGLSITSQ